MDINNNGNTTTYNNNFKSMPRIPYNIIETLALSENQSANDLWKLLKYPTEEALNNDNLTFEEKMEMVWTSDKLNSSEENTFNVFLKPLTPDALNNATEQMQLRIYRNITMPTNNLEAIIPYKFDIITQENCAMVLDETGCIVERTDLMEANILDCLNGFDIGIGSSFFSFDMTMTRVCSSTLNINNGKSLYGRSLIMALRYMDARIGGACSG